MLKLVYAAASLAGLLALASWWLTPLPPHSTGQRLEPTPPRIEAEPLCPWREPDQDQRQFFPEADGHETETRILSGLRVELAQALGRNPTAGENTLRLYRILHGQHQLGTVLTARVKGEYGAIELVVALDTDRAIRGLRLQRSREPEAIAAALQRPEWLASFRGKTARDAWKLGADIPSVPEPAHRSAEAVAEGVRGLLIRFEIASRGTVPIARHDHSP
jgi:hypothetical protein